MSSSHWHSAILCTLIVLFGSCSHAKYGHLTSKRSHQANNSTEKNELVFPVVVTGKLSSKAATWNHGIEAKQLAVDVSKRIELSPITGVSESNHTKRVSLDLTTEESHQLESVAQEKPMETQSFLEFISMVMVFALVCLLIAGIATLLGMAFWKAFLISLAFSIVLILFSMEP